MKVKSASEKERNGVVDAKSDAIIGTYEGEALDSNITNKNGLDITAEVIDYTVTTDDYKDGIKYGWFIGFLGHPEDPGCQNFKEGCIVMRDMKMQDNGRVWAKFDLLSTPVGKIVKTYIDAGVRFGISIRGAGDIIDNSVDPESFVFRGFDLVAFPAYPESIPTFSEIAASTDLADQKKYKAICAAVEENLPAITSTSTIEVLKSQFAKQSEIYKKLDEKEKSLKKVESKQTFNMDEQKVEAVMSLYLEAVSACHDMQNELEQLRMKMTSVKSANRRKIDSIERITAAQLTDTEHELQSVQASYERLKRKHQSDIASMEKRIEDAESSLDSVQASCAGLRKTNTQLKSQIDSLQNSNLLYKKQIDATQDSMSEKDSVISDLRSKLRETVTASARAESRTSNLDEENARLRSEVEMCRKMLHEYQDAFASMYAASLGINPDGISVTDTMSVSEMRKTISSATNTMNIGAAPSYDFDGDEEDFVFYGDSEVGNGMVTM